VDRDAERRETEGAMREKEKKSRPLAKRLRKAMTKAEVVMWVRLRELELLGYKFRKQHPLGPYVADFACIEAMLVVEVDGATHGTPDEVAHDERRSAYLHTNGWAVFRTTNNDVYTDAPRSSIRS
jgi:very-short-patch-repair endonuclease